MGDWWIMASEGAEKRPGKRGGEANATGVSGSRPWRHLGASPGSSAGEGEQVGRKTMRPDGLC